MTKIPRLFELMKMQKMSQKELAEIIGVSQSNVTDWKNGKCIPSAPVLAKIATYFGVSVDYLLGLTDITTIESKPDLLSKNEQYLITLFRQLTPYEQGSIIGRAETFVELHKAAIEEERA